MSDRQRQAQQERRNREREEAAMAAAAAAESAAESSPDVDPTPDEPVMPKVDHSARQEALEALRRKPEDMDEYIRQETEEPAPEPVAESEPVAEAQPEAPAAPEMVTVKIDGEESQVPKADVDALGGVAAYQIHKAAEKRLAQAAKEKHDLAQMLEQAKALIAQNQPKEPVKPPAEILKEKVQQIQFGTPDEAAQALQDILASNTQRVDPNQIVAQAITQMQQNMAAQQFAQRNQDLIQNPVLAKLAVMLEHDKLSKSRPTDWNRFYSDLETELRNAVGKPVTTPQPSVPTPQDGQPTSDRDAKLSRKDNIVNLPTASARVAAPEEEKPLTREDRINLLRKARGQPVG